MRGKRRLFLHRRSGRHSVLFAVPMNRSCQQWEVGNGDSLTSARCCWPVPKVLSFSAVIVLFPPVANSGVLRSTEALVEG